MSSKQIFNVHLAGFYQIIHEAYFDLSIKCEASIRSHLIFNCTFLYLNRRHNIAHLHRSHVRYTLHIRFSAVFFSLFRLLCGTGAEQYPDTLFPDPRQSNSPWN